MKTMKRFFALMVALVLAVSCMSVSAFAADSISVSANANAATAKPGDTIEVVVSVSSASFAGYSMKLGYDSSALKLVSVTKNAANNPGLFSGNANTGVVSMVNDVDFTASGTLFTAKFEVLAGATDGTYTVSLGSASFTKASTERLTTSASGTSVTVKAPHTHNYNKVVTAPTCTEKGYTTYTCSCGDSYKDDEVAALGHKWDNGTVTTPATEGKPGVRTYKCTVCGETKTEEIPALDHTHKYTSTGTAPTCTEDGYITYTCACGDSYKEAGKKATGHGWMKGTVTEPTCDKKGSTVYTCAACGETKTEETAALGHKWEKGAVTEPTCDKKGSTAYKCATCGETKSEEIAALGHKWDKGTVTTEPTEESAGVRTYKCSVCGETKTEKIPALGHTHQNTASVTAPTCTEKGYTTYTCSSCGDSYKGDYVDAKGHSYTEPTFTWGEGNTTCKASYSCSVCKESFTEDAVVTTDGKASCADGGKVTYTATMKLGEKTYTDTAEGEASAKAHSYVTTWTWAEDYSAASLRMVCKSCLNAVEVKGADVTITKETTEPQKGMDGKIVYTATAVVEGETFTDAKTAVIPASEADGGSVGLYIGIAAVVVIAGVAVVVFLKKKKKVA